MSDANGAAPDTAAPEKTKADDKQPDRPANVGEPDWLNDRLARASASAKKSAEAEALKLLGVSSFDEAKASIAKAKELEESKKTEIEKFADKVKALEPVAKRSSELEEKLTRYADAEMARLTDEQKAAVTRIVGDDKTRILDTIEALRPTWVAKTEESKTDEKEPAKKLPAPAKTTASGAPPKGADPEVIDHKAVYERLKEENPMKAARYGLLHASDIYK